MESAENKKYIFICSSKDCKKNGSKQLTKSLSEELKKAGLKPSVVVVKTKCLNHCKKGPNVIVEDCLYHKVKEKELGALLSKLQPKQKI